MYTPKTDIYNALKALGYYCHQGSQSVFADSEIPAITFRVDGNSVNLDMDNEISSQDIDVAVDIWTDDSSEGSIILGEVEEKMRSLNYRLTNSADVAQPDGCLNRITCRFIAVKAQL